ncbi:ComEA family DNA-binding protein [Yanghanlia caeni]|uniref:DUF655 domain-containing protein n=1 Tax=Yanghanlia caeni TaxID=3064283 RepID=A0ABU1D393_9BURK|nr:DUF655 domain-containing protein [Alcaligenaceae bacterium LG-2]HZH57207.1 DUF655 domain-containing protein [Burkholderiaceae bacterium]
MNPFTHSTVATPRPLEGRGRSFGSRSSPTHAGSRAITTDAAASPAGTPSSSSGGRPARSAPPSGRTVRRARLAWGAAMVAAALFAPGVAAALDVNAATTQQLQEIKGIGPKMAQVIVEERERGGRFESLADLSERVKGIGPKKAAAMQSSGLSVGPAAPKPPASKGGAQRR